MHPPAGFPRRSTRLGAGANTILLTTPPPHRRAFSLSTNPSTPATASPPSARSDATFVPSPRQDRGGRLMRPDVAVVARNTGDANTPDHVNVHMFVVHWLAAIMRGWKKEYKPIDQDNAYRKGVPWARGA